MRRRKFVALLGSAAAAWPLAARAQPSPKELRVGLLTIAPRTSYAAFDQRLRELGYVDGQNLTVDFLNPDKYEGGHRWRDEGIGPPESRCHCCALREYREISTCCHRYRANRDDRRYL